eukprot:m.235509 g.235509  ORF g.235509 m.235509 type:complete len:533 (-) comp19340_c1_seq2:155-1753(-)
MPAVDPNSIDQDVFAETPSRSPVFPVLWAPFSFLLICWVLFVTLVNRLPVLNTLTQFTGCNINYAGFHWKGTIFNRSLIKLQLASPKLLRIWFSIGGIVGTAALFLGPALLVYNLYISIPNLTKIMLVSDDAPTTGAGNAGGSLTKIPTRSSGPVLVPLLPGITIPMSHLLYVFAALLINGVFHEAGHALAALNSNVKMIGCGLFVSFGYPGAFVELDSMQLSMRSPTRQLQIYTAGIWHNFALLAVSVAAVQAVPNLLAPWYHYKMGIVSVAHVRAGSALEGSLLPGDVVVDVEGCAVDSSDAWETCVQRLQVNLALGTTGFCTATPVRVFNTTRCCDGAAGDTEESHLCFKIVNDTAAAGHDRAAAAYSCEGARHVFTTSTRRCRTTSDCSDHSRRCLVHADEGPASRLLQVHVRDQPAVLFMGHPLELLRDVGVMEFSRKTAENPILWPPTIYMALHYMTSVSAALGLLNIVPAFTFDGQFAVTALMRRTAMSPQKQDAWVNNVCLSCTVLLISNIAVALLTAYASISR